MIIPGPRVTGLTKFGAGHEAITCGGGSRMVERCQKLSAAVKIREEASYKSMLQRRKSYDLTIMGKAEIRLKASKGFWGRESS